MSRQSTILPAGKVILDKRKLVFSEQPEKPSQVTLSRDGNIIRTIEIQCRCGECLRLDCVYEAETSETS